MFKRILVPLDGSEMSKRALPMALAIAQQNQGKIVLLRVPVLTKMPLPEGVEGLRLFDDTMSLRHDQCRGYLRYIEQTYVDENVPFEVHVAEGDAASVIVDTAVAEEVDLIVMSTHGRTGFRRWVLGSVTEKVLRHATCPVLAVQDDDLPETIMITLDGSHLAERSLEPGLALAESLGAQVILVRVQEPIEALTEEERTQKWAKEVPWLHDLTGSMHKDTLSYLQQIAAHYNQEHETHMKVAVTHNYAADGIIDFAERYDVDLIVMTTHGDSGNGRWTYGSVTEKVVWSAPCAMLVIRAL
jgi:nucleotide-binding universal stress UspA family protein